MADRPASLWPRSPDGRSGLADFRNGFVDVGTSITDGTTLMAAIDWSATSSAALSATRRRPPSPWAWRSAATGHVAVSPLTWLSTGQSTGEAIPITLSTSRTWNGQFLTVSASTMVDWER
jgi:hypothetical protein